MGRRRIAQNCAQNCAGIACRELRGRSHLRLNLSKRQNVDVSVCIPSASRFRSYGVIPCSSNTSAKVIGAPSFRRATTSSGTLLNFFLMKRSKCFWFIA